MIKGVNKSIIEVHDTGYECFDKVILFVNSSYRPKNANIQSEVKKLISEYASSAEGDNSKIKRNRERKRIRTAVFAVTSLASAFIGAGVFNLLQNIF